MSLNDTALPPYNASDPLATFVNASCFDLLYGELVPLTFRVVEETLRRRKQYDSSTANGHISTPALSSSAASTPQLGTTANTPNPSGATLGADLPAKHGSLSLPGGVSPAIGGPPLSGATDIIIDEQQTRDMVKIRLQALGYRVGQGLAERFVRERPRFTDHLEVIKFLCKDMWTLVFRKQIDNLKTNHRGVYVLSDHSFYPFRNMSMKSPQEALGQAQPYLWFPSGIIKGVLSSLGIEATVHAETSELPSAQFQIKTIVPAT